MRFLSVFVSVLAISCGVSAMSAESDSYSTINNAGGRGHADMNLEAGRYESHSHGYKIMASAEAEFKYSQYDTKFGPTKWGAQLVEGAPAWATCSSGQSQSPVALPNYYKAKPDTAGILQKLNPSYGDILNVGMTANSLELVNTGHALQVNLPTAWIESTTDTVPQNALTLTGGAVGKNPYVVQQLHMHGRSEHSISGARFPLEIHIVHKDLARFATNPTDPRLLSVVGIMVEESPDNTDNPALTPLVDTMKYTNTLNYSSTAFTKVDTKATVTTPFSITNLLPKNLDFYHYNGSLTTPPCSEQVVWHVLTTPITASRAQILALTAPFGDVGNARPTQPLFARQVIVSSFQTAPLNNNNGVSTISMTLAGVMSIVMTVARMF